jgi:hypothetical protein
MGAIKCNEILKFTTLDRFLVDIARNEEVLDSTCKSRRDSILGLSTLNSHAINLTLLANKGRSVSRG